MAIQNTSEAYVLAQTAGDTYNGDSSDQTYSINPNLIEAGDTISIIDQGGDNIIELPAGLTITSSLVISNQTILTLSNGAVVDIRGADTFTFNVGQNLAAGDTTGTNLTFSEFTENVLGVMVPAPGEPVVTGGGSVVNDDGTADIEGDTTPEEEAEAAIAAAETAAATAAESLAVAAKAQADADAAEAAVTDLASAEAYLELAETAQVAADAAAADAEVAATAAAAAVAATAETAAPEDDAEAAALASDAETAVSDAEAAQTTANAEVVTAQQAVEDFTLTFDFAGPATVEEGATATYTVTASLPVEVDTDVTFQLVAGDAAAADQGTNTTNLNDFAQGAFTEVTVTILAGDTTAEFDVESLNDSITELSEDYTVTASVDGAPLAPVTTLIVDGGGETFVLTPGVDLITGTANTDTIIGFVEEDSNALAATSTFTAGDNINGNDGDDTLEIINLTDNLLNFNGKTIINVENLLITNADANFNFANIANKMFDTVTIDTGGDSNLGDFDIDNINAASAVILENFGSDYDDNVNLNFQTSTATTAVTDITVSDVDFNELYLDVDANFTNATDYTFNFTSENVDANDNFNVNSNVTLDAADIMMEVNVNIDNLQSDTDGNFEFNFDTNGVEMATVNVNMAETDFNALYVDIDDSNNGTGTADIANITLTDVESDDNLQIGHMEDITLVINGEVILDDLYFEDYEGDQTLDIVANGNLTIEADLDMNDNAFNQTVTVSGAGNVDLGDVRLVQDANTTQMIDALALTGDLTVLDDNAAIDMFTSGIGNDSLTLGTFETMAEMGDGDDFVDTNSLDYGDANAGTLDGGAGDNDTIVIDDAANFDADTADNISNFEILEIGGGTGAYDLSLEASLNGVSITNAAVAVGLTSVTGAAAGTTLDFALTEGGDTMLSDTAFSFALDDDTGTDDSLDISFFASDDDTDTTAEEQITAGLTANGIETINIMSMAETLSEESAPGADDALMPGDYVNTFTFIGDDAEEITISGDSMFDLTLGTATAGPMVVSLIDATANTGGVMVDASVQNGGTGVNTVAVSFNGSDADDTFDASEIGDVVQGNGGADTINLDVTGANVVEETIRYVDAADSQITLTDGDDDGDADTFAGQDMISAFVAGEDKIELSSQLGLATGDARSALNQLGSFTPTEDLADVFEGFGVDFFDDGLVDRAVAFMDDGTDGYVFVDANSDGDFSTADDMVIELTGVTALTISDFTFG